MEIRSLQSSTVTRIPSALTRTVLRERPFFSGQVIKIPNSKRHPDGRKIKLLDFRVQASGTTKFSSEAIEAIPKDVNLKDEDLVFVAGATGRVGSRTVRELLKLGFRVRAGVRSAQRAKSILQSVQQMGLGVEVTATEKLEIVECDLEKRDQIGPALGNASIIICCIGASEKEVFDITGPYRIDYQATKNLIDAAIVAKVNHFILLTSLGTNKVGFPAAILNLFWGVLIWKRKAEEALLASGLPYTIVRPGGMERPTDAYKETHNVTLSQEDTLFGGQVSNLQVAELMAFMAKNRSFSYCKVVEVIAETTVPLTPMGELLVKIPSQRAEAQPVKESYAADGPEPAVSKGIVSETPSTPVKKEPANVKAVPTRPLSPYIVYDDLKLPVYPIPNPPGGQKYVNVIDALSKPTPMDDKANNASGMTAVTVESISAAVEMQITMPLSPYTVYNDLKPPTSPTPNAPTFSLPSTSSLDGGSQLATVSGNSRAHPTSADKPGNEQHFTEPKGRPLSPFTMYEDLKPPASPMPSPRKL